MKAEIITIGDEILIGQIIDTNSAWIAEQFNLNGIEIYQITSVHDNHEHILEALKKAEEKVDLVIMTGGLGPTKDDITKNALCDYFNTKLVFHQPTFEHIKTRFTKLNIDVNKLNRDQALVPESCTVLFNKAGTAPGLWFEKSDTYFVSVPGVPFEMKYLVENEILPRLRVSGKAKAIYHKTVLTQGLPESMLAMKLEKWEDALPANIKLAYLPSPMAVRLRLSATGSVENDLRVLVESEIEELQKIIPDHIYGYNNETMAEVIGRMLKNNGKNFGCSRELHWWVHFSFNHIGSGLFCILQGFGYCLFKRNKGKHSWGEKQHACPIWRCKRRSCEGNGRWRHAGFKYRFCFSTTGIAGPDGGTAEKPVGTVWLAVASKNGVTAQKYVFGDNRERNISRSSQTALQMLRRVVLNELQ
jgi:nicotinamide-nucleotide amidase